MAALFFNLHVSCWKAKTQLKQNLVMGGKRGGGGGVDKIFRTKRKRKKKLLLLGLPNNALNLRLAFHQ